MPIPQKQLKHLDMQADLVGVAETIGDKLSAAMEATEEPLRELLIKELTVLKRWQLDGSRSLKEIYERWEKLRESIAAVRMQGVKNATQEMLADTGTIAAVSSKQAAETIR